MKTLREIIAITEATAHLADIEKHDPEIADHIRSGNFKKAAQKLHSMPRHYELGAFGTSRLTIERHISKDPSLHAKISSEAREHVYPNMSPEDLHAQYLDHKVDIEGFSDTSPKHVEEQGSLGCAKIESIVGEKYGAKALHHLKKASEYRSELDDDGDPMVDAWLHHDKQYAKHTGANPKTLHDWAP